MKIIFAGNGERGARCLEAILNERKDEIVSVVTHPGSPTTAQELENLAEEYGIPTLSPEKINRRKSVEELSSYHPDLMILAGYNQILKKQVIEIPSIGCINLHGGRLPDYRGASVINWAMINGESEIGLSIIYVDTGIDTGDIIAETSFPLNYEDTIKEVQERVIELFPPLLLKTLDQIRDGTEQRKVQNQKEGKYWHKRKPEDGEIDWNKSALDVYNFVRALTHPYPGAFTYHKDKKIIVWSSKPYEGTYDGQPRKIISESPLIVSTGRGLIELLDIEYSESLKVGNRLEKKV